MQYPTQLYLLLVLACFCVLRVNSTGHVDEEYDVIILGAGIAGISAASKLVTEGITNFVILEGKDVVGGRVQSQPFGNYTVNTGAMWIQAVKSDSENPIYKAALKYNISTYPSDYSDVIFYDENGQNLTEEGLQVFDKLDEAWDKMIAYGEKLWANRYRDDISLKGSFRWFGFKPKTPLEMACEYFYADFEAAEQTGLISNRYFVSSYLKDFGDEDYFVVDQGGYSTLPLSILSNNVPDWNKKLHLKTVVTAINYTDDNVVVMTDKGIFTGKKIICTFSIGVLQNSLVQFYPSLPEWKLQALHAFGMNDFISITVRFHPNIIWFVPHDTEWVVHASQRRGYYPAWHNLNKIIPESHMLQAFVTGDEARRLQTLSDEEVKSEMMTVLRDMFGNEVPEAEEILLPRILSDPFFQGSFSDWPVGYTRSQHNALRAAVGSVHFAGESYSPHYFGYVHGAYISGHDEAKAVAACMEDNMACMESYVPPYDAVGCTYRLAINYDPNAQIDDGSCMLVARAPTSGSGGIHGCIKLILLSVIIKQF